MSRASCGRALNCQMRGIQSLCGTQKFLCSTIVREPMTTFVAQQTPLFLHVKSKLFLPNPVLQWLDSVLDQLLYHVNGVNRIQDQRLQLEFQNTRFRVRWVPSSDLSVCVRFQLGLHLDLKLLEGVAFDGRLAAVCELNLFSKAKYLCEIR